MAAKRSSYSPLKAGVDPRKEAVNEGGQNWLTLKPGEQFDVTILVEPEDILTCEQCAIWLEKGENSPVWVYTGPEDPSHELKIERRYRAFLPVLTEDGESKVWSMGKMSHRQLLDMADAAGYLAGMEVRIKRTGAGLATRYSISSRAKRRNVSSIPEVDVIALLGPTSPEDVRELIAQKLELPDYDAVLERFLGKAAVKAKKSGSKKAAPPVDEDEDEDEFLGEDDDEELELK